MLHPFPTTYLPLTTNSGQPIELESLERIPLRHQLRYLDTWWQYSFYHNLTPLQQSRAIAQAHRAALAIADRINTYI